MMSLKLFTDPYYHSDDYLDFDPNEVVKIELRTASLFLRGKHQVTYITLKSGGEYGLVGDVAAEIEAARLKNVRD